MNCVKKYSPTGRPCTAHSTAAGGGVGDGKRLLIVMVGR